MSFKFFKTPLLILLTFISITSCGISNEQKIAKSLQRAMKIQSERPPLSTSKTPALSSSIEDTMIEFEASNKFYHCLELMIDSGIVNERELVKVLEDIDDKFNSLSSRKKAKAYDATTREFCN